MAIGGGRHVFSAITFRFHARGMILGGITHQIVGCRRRGELKCRSTRVFLSVCIDASGHKDPWGELTDTHPDSPGLMMCRYWIRVPGASRGTVASSHLYYGVRLGTCSRTSRKSAITQHCSWKKGQQYYRSRYRDMVHRTTNVRQDETPDKDQWGYGYWKWAHMLDHNKTSARLISP